VACQKRETQIAKLLVSRGASVNFSGDNGYTPLHIAVEDGDVDLTTFLLESGADPMAKTNDGHTVLNLSTTEDMWNAISKHLQSRRRPTSREDKALHGSLSEDSSDSDAEEDEHGDRKAGVGASPSRSSTK
jgi:hypothetical protein